MANAFFRLRISTSKKPQLIYLGYKFGNDQLIYPTGIKVLPKHWDFSKSRVKNVVEVWNKDDINAFLIEIAEFTNSVANSYKSQKKLLTKTTLKQEIDKYLNPPVVVESIKFFPFLEQYISDLETGVRMIKGNKIADPKTVQRYKTAKNSLLEFQKISGHTITFELWSESLWDEYIQFLTFTKKYKINNIGFYQKQLLIYLKAARKAKLLVADWLDEKTILSEAPDDIFWTKKEILHMENFDLSDDERLDRVRDLTLIGCSTGFRISDWPQVHPDNFKVTEEGNRYIEIIPDKANATPPSAPLLPIVEQILAKYNGVLPVISDQKYNEYLKELCKKLSHTKLLKVRYVKEGKMVVDTVEQWTQASSHTCRRSYATNMFLDGVEPYLIMKATGHESEKSFKKYLKLDNSVAVNAMAKHKQEK